MRNAISLFSGAGGMDIGIKEAGFNILWANDFDKAACETYRANHENPIVCGDIYKQYQHLKYYQNIDLVFGGPPCQGFSVAGKMDPNDERSKLLWAYLDVVEIIKPKVFICENVKALGKLEKWNDVRNAFIKRAKIIGYGCNYIILNASEFNVPQARERVFFIGIKDYEVLSLSELFNLFKKEGKTVKEAIKGLGKEGSKNNLKTCNAEVTIASNPVLRKSPYAGMLFNGLGRPVKINGYCATLPASMGGNKTPIIDEEELHDGKDSWVEEYHSKIMNGGKPLNFKGAPKRLRRLTINESKRLQTFPDDYIFKGSNSAIYRQIGNAVPCNLAKAVGDVASHILEILEKNNCIHDTNKSENELRLLA